MYPEKPILGTTKITKPILKITLIRLKINVIPVFPKPCRILDNVPDIYKNGHKNDKALIWLAAISLLKSQSPIKSAKIKKNKKQNIPTKKQNRVLKMMVFLICLKLPDDSSSETEGNRRLATEPVRAWGNIIRGIAMPENTPYTDNASFEVIPLSMSFWGSLIVS
jgi:hypothetical protein